MWIVSGLVGCLMVYTFFTTTGRWWKLSAAFLAVLNFIVAYRSYFVRGEELTTLQLVVIGTFLYLSGVWTTTFVLARIIAGAKRNLSHAASVLDECVKLKRRLDDRSRVGDDRDTTVQRDT